MLEGILRESTSKAATNTLRRDGYLIANIYGRGVENINAAFKRNDFIRYVRNKSSLKFSVKVGGKEYPVIIQEYQKHPVSADLLHVDMRIVNDTQEATYMVPVKTQGSPVGLKNKGVLVMNKRRIPVQCTGKDLPDAFVLDVSDLDVGDALLVRDIEMPAGVRAIIDGRVSVTGVIKAK